MGEVKRMVESVLVTKHGNKGYVASLRFKDKSLDEDVSHYTRQGIYKTITYLMYKKGILKVDK